MEHGGGPAAKVAILRPERVTSEKRYDLLFITRLQRVPCYNEILRHLTQGQSVRSLAAWLTDQRIEGPAGRWSRRYWEKLLQPLDRQVVAAKERAQRAARRQSRHPQPPSVETMTQTLAEVINPQHMVQRSLTNRVGTVWKEVDQALDAITAERVLKCAFMLQQKRIDGIMELEEKLKLVLPEGNKALEVLRKIGGELTRNEAFRKGLPPDDTVTPPPQSDLSRRLAEMDPVDRNLFRSASLKIITMIQEEQSGRSATDGLEPDASGTASSPEQGTEPDVHGDVAGDS